MQYKNVIFITEDVSFPIDEGMKKYNYSLVQYLSINYLNFKLFTRANNDLTIDYERMANKFFISTKLYYSIRKFKPDLIIYSPESSGTLFSFIRLLIIRCYYFKSKTILINLQRRDHNWVGKKIIKLFQPDWVVAFSKNDCHYFNKIGITTILSKTGVDIHQFKPVNNDLKWELRKKYGFNESDKIALHVGHIKKTRNVDVLKALTNEDYKVIIIGSTSTSSDEELRNDLLKHGIKIINTYLSKIEEIYQLSDVYVFTALNDHSAIEFPLSVLEAMACNLPVVTTPYGSISDYFAETKCFTFFNNQEELINQIGGVLRTDSNNRAIVSKNFSWDSIFNALFKNIELL